MSDYLHCPTCRCAYNIAREPACPRCGVRAGTPADPRDDVVAAVEQLARAIARATPGEIAAAEATLDARLAQLALPASTARVDSAPPDLLRAVRVALAPAPAPAPEPEGDRRDADRAAARPRVPTLLVAVLARVAPQRQASWRAILDAAFVRLSPRLAATTAAPAATASTARGVLRAARAWGVARLRGPITRARETFARAA